MNLVLTYCGREWRAQRWMMLLFLVLVVLATGVVLVLAHDWTGGVAGALQGWAVIVGGAGSIAILAPALVTSELGVRDDQFVRRLPGALLPALLGKLMFLCLGVVGLTLILMALATLVSALLPDSDLRWTHDTTDLLLAGSGAALWIWAVTLWLPRGRMGLPVALCFLAVPVAMLMALDRWAPGLQWVLPIQTWLRCFPAFAVALVAGCCLWGRRRGGWQQSALFGGFASGLALVPVGVVCADWWHRYHHPNPEAAHYLLVAGASPDLNTVVVSCSESPYLPAHAFAIDIRSGAVARMGAASDGLAPLTEPFQGVMRAARWWRVGERSIDRVFDLNALAFVPKAEQASIRDGASAPAPTPARSRWLNSDLHAPGVRCWFDGTDLCFGKANGDVERMPWMGSLPVEVRPFGHGFVGASLGSPMRVFDLIERRWLPENAVHDALLVGGRLVQEVDLPRLPGHYCVGPIGDDRVLLIQSHGSVLGPARFVAWRPADDSRVPIHLPPIPGSPKVDFVSIDIRAHRGPLAPCVDPRGALWVVAVFDQQMAWLAIDQTTLQMSPAFPGSECMPHQRLIGWPDAEGVLVQVGNTIQRIELATGARTQLFPRR